MTYKPPGKRSVDRQELAEAQLRAVDRYTWEKQLRDDPDVVGSLLLVLLVLGSYYSKTAESARVPIKRIADSAGLGQRTVTRLVGRGSEMGWIFRSANGQRLGNGVKLASEYLLTVPAAVQRADLLDATQVADREGALDAVQVADRDLSLDAIFGGSRCQTDVSICHPDGTPSKSTSSTVKPSSPSGAAPNGCAHGCHNGWINAKSDRVSKCPEHRPLSDFEIAMHLKQATA